METVLYNSRAMKAYIELLKDRYPHVDLADLLESAGMEVHQIDDEGHWFTQEHANRFYSKIVELTGNPHIAFEAGEYAVSRKGLGSMRAHILSFVGPEKAFSVIEKWASEFSRSSRYTAKTIKPQTVEMVVKTMPGVREEPFQCENRLGYCEGLGQLFRLPAFKVEHTECMFNGGDCCRYQISWGKFQGQWLRTLKFRLFPPLAGLMLIGTMLLSPQLLLSVVVPILLALFLLIGWLVASQEAKQLDETLQLIREASTETIDSIQIDYIHSQIINEIGQILGLANLSEQLPEEIFPLFLDKLGFEGVLLLLGNPEKERPVWAANFGLNTSEQQQIAETFLPTEDPDRSTPPWISAYSSEAPIVLRSRATDPATSERPSLEATDIVSCPVLNNGTPLGTLTVFRRRPELVLRQKDVHLLMAIASQIGLHLHNNRLNRKIIQAQKLESVGLLAGGVAHDFNNVLTIVLGYSSILGSDPEMSENARQELKTIEDAAKKGAAFTRQLLAFSKKQVTEPKVLSVMETVQGIMKLAQHLIGSEVEVQVNFDDDLPNIFADASQIEQIVLNLAINARDAMPSGGELRVAVQRGQVAHDSSGAQVIIEVTDTGEGMSAEVRDKIFDPFFTTKPAGKGTGMGLATVHNIVQQLGGQIAVNSELGQGTTFTVRLPACSESPLQSFSDQNMPPPRGKETVLLADDEQTVRELIQEILEKQGYRVTLARDGEQALQLMEGTSEPFDLLLSDMSMPRLNGIDLAIRYQESYPAGRTLLITGFVDESNRSRADELGLEIMYKPILPRELAIKVRDILDREQLLGEGKAVND